MHAEGTTVKVATRWMVLAAAVVVLASTASAQNPEREAVWSGKKME